MVDGWSSPGPALQNKALQATSDAGKTTAGGRPTFHPFFMVVVPVLLTRIESGYHTLVSRLYHRHCYSEKVLGLNIGAPLWLMLLLKACAWYVSLIDGDHDMAFWCFLE